MIISCKCGCGATFEDHDKHGRKREYISGHNSKDKGFSFYRRYLKGKDNPRFGTHLSEETKQKIRLKRLGAHPTKETCMKMSKTRIERGTFRKEKNPNFGKTGKLSANYGKPPSPLTTYGTRCYYQSPLQGEVCFRSSYELLYAKYLDSIHELWLYEIECFDLGNNTYTPDFFLPRLNKFVEIKGYIFPDARKKIDLFKEQYPFELDVLCHHDLEQLGCKLNREYHINKHNLKYDN